MVQNGHGVGGGAELGAAVRHAGNAAGLHGQGHLVGDALLGGHVGDLLRRAGAQVDDGVLGQLHGRAAGQDLLGVQGNGRNGVHGDAELAGQGAVVGHAQALHVVLNRAYHNGIHIDTGNFHQLGVQRTALDDLLHLDDDLAAGVLGGLGLGGDVQGADLTVDGAVAVLVGIGAPEEADVDGEALVQQALLTLDLDELHQVLLGDLVQLAAAVAGVGEGVQAHVGDGTDVVGGDITVHVGDDALGQVVGLDLVGQSQVAQLGSAVPVAAHHALDHALMAVMVAAGAVPVALAGREEQRQVSGMAGLQKALFQGGGQRLGAGAADETAGGDGVAVIDHQGRFLSGDHTNFLHACFPSFLCNFRWFTCSGSAFPCAFPGRRSCPPSGRRWRSTWQTARSPERCRHRCPSACRGQCRPWNTSRRWERWR